MKKSISTFLQVSAALLLGVTATFSFAQESPKSDAAASEAVKPDGAMPKINYDSKPLAASTPSYAPIVEKVSPSVVTISTSKMVKGVAGGGGGQGGNNPLLDPLFRRFFGIPDQGEGNDEPAPAPNHKKRNENEGSGKPHKQALGLGSGVIVSADGYILTNNHVVDGADDIEVTIGSSSHEYKARRIGVDPGSDIAVIKIEATDLPAITFADSERLRPGDIVVAVGNPFGFTQSATMGIVSAIGRGGMGITDYENFIQTDAAINMGNSGGALVDFEGRLVGINTAIFSRTGQNNGIGFAVPANLARSAMESIIKTGHVQRGFLGVGLQPLSDDLVKAFKLKNDEGALISEVQPKSPAEKAGVQTGDVVIAVDKKPVKSPRELQLVIGGLAPKAKVELTLLREGKEQTVTVDLAERPSKGVVAQTEQNDSEPDVLDGVTVADIDAEARKEMNIPENIKGVVITAIDPDSPSASVGLQRGDVVLEINREAVTKAKQAVDLSEKLKKEKKVLLRVYSHGGTKYVVVERK